MKYYIALNLKFPSLRIANSAYVLRSCIVNTAPQMIRDRKYHLQTNEACLVGSEMVDFLIHLSPIVHSRSLAIGMWQALLEEGTIAHGNRFNCFYSSFTQNNYSFCVAKASMEHCFKDKYLFYRFTISEDNRIVQRNSSKAEKTSWENQLNDTLMLLAQLGPDATLRMILRKP